MLNIFYGSMPEAVFNTDVYFRNTYDGAWLLTPFAKAMIQDVDSSTVLGSGVIDSPVLGMIPPERLSGGVKTLLLMLNDAERIFNASTCGDNCAKWILKIAEEVEQTQGRELTINLRHLMRFGEGEFLIHILNTDQVVHSMRELVPIVVPFV